jgi:hypothetical protein
VVHPLFLEALLNKVTDLEISKPQKNTRNSGTADRGTMPRRRSRSPERRGGSRSSIDRFEEVALFVLPSTFDNEGDELSVQDRDEAGEPVEALDRDRFTKTEQDPKWVDSTDMEDSNQKHTHEAFQKFMEHMKAGSTPAEESNASEEKQQTAAIKLEPLRSDVLSKPTLMSDSEIGAAADKIFANFKKSADMYRGSSQTSMQSSMAVDDMDMDGSKDDQDGSDNDIENGKPGRSSKKKKGQRFFCTEFPPCNLSFTRSEHLARHIRFIHTPVVESLFFANFLQKTHQRAAVPMPLQ